MIAAVAKTKKERDLIFQYLEQRKKQDLLLSELKSFTSSTSTALSPSSVIKPSKIKNKLKHRSKKSNQGLVL